MSCSLVDALGSVRHLTDANGAVVRGISYDAFGRLRHSTGSAFTTLGFTGERMGAVDGTVYLRARHYQPALGRFLQRDSFPGIINRPQSLNRYAYAENNPGTWVDPGGRCLGWIVGDPSCPPPFSDERDRERLDRFGAGVKDATVDLVVTGVILSQAPALAGTATMVLIASPRARAHAWEVASHYASHPEEVVGNVAWGLVQPLADLYCGWSQDDPYRMGRGVPGTLLYLVGPEALAGKGGAAGASGAARGTLKPIAGGAPRITTLWRAVKERELLQILRDRRFVVPEGMAEGKYFSITREGAERYARMAYRSSPEKGPYWVTRAEVPEDFMLPGTVLVDRGIPSVVIPSEMLEQLGRPRLMPDMMLPKP